MKAGLAAKRPDGSLRDYFFDRFMFPIRDVKGAFVGFGGRTLGDGEPKYLNTAQTPVFDKSRVLYGLFEGLAETRKARKAHLMEGYMDVIASHQHGLKTACAPLGTALTPEHALLIKRYVDSVAIVFDADNAGQNAAVRGAETALESGLTTRVASVPEGKDPDDFLHAKGLEAFQQALDGAADLPAFKTELLIKRAGELTPEAKSAIAKDVMSTIVRCPDEVLKDEWVRRLASRLGLNEESLRRSGGKGVAQSSRRPASAAAPAPAPSAPVKAAAMPPADLQLLGVLFKTPGSAAELQPGDLESASAREIVGALKALSLDGKWGPRLLDALQPAERAAASRLLGDELGYDDPAETLKTLLGKRRTMRRLKEIEPLVVSGREPGLKDEYHRLVAELKATKR
ncbi:MAG: toprim domain-containing protein [Elusimicrobiota bacterium]|nr:MAG: toprim domain-containing protein [Elusimicrobiota bacterium]